MSMNFGASGFDFFSIYRPWVLVLRPRAWQSGNKGLGSGGAGLWGWGLRVYGLGLIEFRGYG